METGHFGRIRTLIFLCDTAVVDNHATSTARRSFRSRNKDLVPF